MPIYEFRCDSCRRRFTIFTRSITGQSVAACQHCGSEQVSRIMSRVAVLRASEDYSSESPPGLDEVDEDDPRSIARWVRRMSRQMGEPLEPEMEAELERMEAGELPDDEMGYDDEEELTDVD